MGSIAATAHSYIYNEDGHDKVLINCKNCIENKSKIPLAVGPNEQLDVRKLIVQIQGDCGKIAAKLNVQENFYDYVVNFLAVRVLMKTAMPLRVLQIGSMGGRLSYQLASLIGAYNPESYFCCVCSAVGNESGNYWLDWIAQVEHPPKLSMLAADYDDTQLQAKSFDLIVVNGEEPMEQPYHVLQETGRLLKEGGAVLCYSYKQPLLADCFRMVFGPCEEFGGETQQIDKIVLWASDVKQIWAGETGLLTEAEITAYLDAVQAALRLDTGRDALRVFLSGLDAYVDRAIEQKRVDFKVRLMEMKGRVLDCMCPPQDQ